jgi:23S rRNA (cytidine1920-2'-O)/16S rRNA (cytidine1409-2'-O)-methyltransferase
MPRIRIDILVHARGLTPSRELARRLVMAGEVTVDGRVVDQPSAPVDESAEVAVLAGSRYVGRGGYKLEKGLDVFGVAPVGWVAADVGASTGGFTDCLLQHGAARVYAIDVGYGQLAWQLRQDSRVIVMERTNARYLAALPEPVRLVTIDASFISLRLLLPVVQRWLQADGQVIALIKPQFEVGARQVGKGGVVRDSRVHQQVLSDLVTWADEQGWSVGGLTCSPLRGPKGNVEFLLLLSNAELTCPPPTAELVARALDEARVLMES